MLASAEEKASDAGDFGSADTACVELCAFDELLEIACCEENDSTTAESFES
ncbi:hypothetical protein GCM10011613_35530 [Cellvibrio zantedeschiae]|uniref:Uncharacterized protein n=1 Tax=Cellvibrio zantedeschiae TaxID=1237077 RepID=A0ABQ3BA38_9GAMM|nr:hypothetical protein GCM10011613_35530 [Cellvibrio zantedeschiae]